MLESGNFMTPYQTTKPKTGEGKMNKTEVNVRKDRERNRRGLQESKIKKHYFIPWCPWLKARGLRERERERERLVNRFWSDFHPSQVPGSSSWLWPFFFSSMPSFHVNPFPCFFFFLQYVYLILFAWVIDRRSCCCCRRSTKWCTINILAFLRDVTRMEATGIRIRHANQRQRIQSFPDVVRMKHNLHHRMTARSSILITKITNHMKSNHVQVNKIQG